MIYVNFNNDRSLKVLKTGSNLKNWVKISQKFEVLPPDMIANIWDDHEKLDARGYEIEVLKTNKKQVFVCHWGRGCINMYIESLFPLGT